MAALLDVRDLTVDYRRRRAVVHALRGATFEVQPGETVGLVGESGSGKSTIARAVLGLSPVTGGSVSFAGRDITHLPFKERREVYRDLQIVFQDPHSSLNPSRTVGRTLAEPLEAQGEHDRAAVHAAVSEMLERVHLPRSAAERYPSEFSGGQKQRIAIARALMLSPRLVICDEPVSALDLSVRAQVINLLQDLQREAGLSYLFVSHDLEVVRHICDRVVVLYRGQVMERGGARDVAAAPTHPYTHALHQAAPLPDPRLQHERRRAAAVTRPPDAGGRRDIPDDGCPFAPRCPHASERCWVEYPVLRPTHTMGETACRRYPQWQQDRP